jgi:ribosome-binding factor A
MTRLEEHRSAFQSELARRVTMKFTPHLLFHLDESIARGSRIVEILQQIDADSEKQE